MSIADPEFHAASYTTEVRGVHERGAVLKLESPAMRWTTALWRNVLALVGLTCLAGCGSADRSDVPAPAGQFASDVAFLRQHTEVVILGDESGAQVAVAPAYQGRVMTSTT